MKPLMPSTTTRGQSMVEPAGGPWRVATIAATCVCGACHALAVDGAAVLCACGARLAATAADRFGASVRVTCRPPSCAPGVSR